MNKNHIGSSFNDYLKKQGIEITEEQIEDIINEVLK